MEKSSINKTILIGRLGNNPESRYTPSGRSYSYFSIATDEYWTDNNNHFSKNCVVVTNSVVWTAVNNCLLSDK